MHENTKFGQTPQKFSFGYTNSKAARKDHYPNNPRSLFHLKKLTDTVSD